MIKKLARKIFGSRNDRLVKEYKKAVANINQYEDEYQKLDDQALTQKTQEFKERFQKGETLEQLLPEAFAVVREASKRVLGMRHYDVQMIGGMVLNDGKISEMKTGEGKTLVATLACYLNALSGKGVHVITVNDYLASRDAKWMNQLYSFLGLSTGVIVSGLEHEQRKAAYASDITYGTNNEFGFDYLRDNMAFTADDKVQRDINYAIIDEVDSILIDEARTPLIISGSTGESSDLYQKMNTLVPNLTASTQSEDDKEPDDEEEPDGDYTISEKNKNLFLTEQGHETVEKLLVKDGLLKENESLYDPKHISLMHHVTAALRANVLFNIDVDYVVKGNEIVIVDEFTGRTMEGRRWSDGLHQAIEAKEGVAIQNENQTLASITFQNYFRLYEKLSGMTGTADTEAFEFQSIYNLEVVVIPTNKPMVRLDNADQVYLNFALKFDAVVVDIQSCVKRNQPVLVGTTSIETSEFLASKLKEADVPHEVLNAKQHEKEAYIVENAGCPGAVTIATNMAGRGTDIVLGGNLDALLDKSEKDKHEEIKTQWDKDHATVIAAGGLHIIGTERHESRRIDNQLRGRAGRQGDPGSTRFYLSLEDPLMRMFVPERMANMMRKLGLDDGEAIEHSMVSNAIEKAQRKVEAHNFDIRKNLLEYDDVANEQRRIIYSQRSELMASEDISAGVISMRKDTVAEIFAQHIPPGSMEESWDVPKLEAELKDLFGDAVNISSWLKEDDSLHEETLREKVVAHYADLYDEKRKATEAEYFSRMEKTMMMQVLDQQWKEHLAAMDYLRQSIGLRGYAQKNPKQEYKRESFEMFASLFESVKSEVIGSLSKIEVPSLDQIREYEAQIAKQQQEIEFNYEHVDFEGLQAEEQTSISDDSAKPFVRPDVKIGRNEPCPCNSGKKYKQCHGKLT
jgi:preprotein translocase subunit SecA